MKRKFITYFLMITVLLGCFAIPVHAISPVIKPEAEFAITNVGVSNVCKSDTVSFILTLRNTAATGKSYTVAYSIERSDGTVAENKSFTVDVSARTTKLYPYKIKLPGYDAYQMNITVSSGSAVLLNETHKFSYVKKSAGIDTMIGMSTQITNGYDDDAKTIPQMEDAGFGIVRDSIRWDRSDNGDGTYTVPAADMEWINRANAAGMKVILLAWNGHEDYNNGALPASDEDLAELKSYTVQIAEQLKGKIWAYEVWNEPNNYELSTNNQITTGADYAKVLKTVYEGIRSVDKETTIIGGALTPVWEEKQDTVTYMREMMDAGAGNYMDGFSIHPYSYESGGVYYDEGNPADNLDAQITYAENILKEYNFNKGIYVTEIGASTHNRYWSVTEWQQAVSLARIATMAEADSRIKATTYYTWIEKSTDPSEQMWGVVSYKYGNAKPAYGALSFRNHILGGIENRRKVEQGVYEYSKKSGGSVFALWSEKGASESFSVGTADAVGYSANKISCPADYIVKAYDMYGNEIAITGNAITVTEAPVYVSCMPADSADISVKDGVATVSGALSDREQPVTVVAKESITGKMAYVNQVYADAEGLYSVDFPIDPNAVTTVAVFNGNEKLDRNMSNVGMLDIRFYSGGKEVFLADGLPEGDINVKIKTDYSQELMAFAAVSGENGVLLSADSGKVVNNSETSLNVTIEEGAGFKLMLWDTEMKPKIKPVISE